MEKTPLFKNINNQVKDLDEKKGIVTIYINSFDNEDTDGDISVRGSFKRTFKNNIDRIKHFLNHDIYKLIGVPIELYEDDWGPIAVSQLNMKKQLSKDVFEDYRLYAEHDKSLEHSIRVNAIKRDSEDERKVLEWKLWEYSTLYGWGANSETPLIDIKGLEDLEMMIRDGNYSDEKARLIETTYEKLKKLLNSSDDDPLATLQAADPATLEEDESALIYFFNKLKI
jgi:HK97 family phage prohead protease